MSSKRNNTFFFEIEFTKMPIWFGIYWINHCIIAKAFCVSGQLSDCLCGASGCKILWMRFKSNSLSRTWRLFQNLFNETLASYCYFVFNGCVGTNLISIPHLVSIDTTEKQCKAVYLCTVPLLCINLLVHKILRCVSIPKDNCF